MQGRTSQAVSLLFDDALPVCAPVELNCLGTMIRVCRCDTRRRAGASERAPRRMDIMWAGESVSLRVRRGKRRFYEAGWAGAAGNDVAVKRLASSAFFLLVDCRLSIYRNEEMMHRNTDHRVAISTDFVFLSSNELDQHGTDCGLV
jgi:hypothetical protein